ncbi:MAG: flagellar basal body rod C-terminal domain-containing protein, partial [Lautropia sp.]
RISGTTIGVDASHVGSGEIAGLLRFRDQDLAAAQGRVGQLAAAIASAYNQQQALGIDANGGAGAALFGVAGVQVAAAHSNQGGAEFSVTVTDPAQLAATDYRLHFDGVNYQLENLVDGSMRTLPGFPATIDGMQIELAHGSMTIGDKFTIKGASQFASGMALTLNNGAGLATGLAGSAQAGAANAGSVAVAGFEQQTVDGNAAAGVTITFTSATTFDVTGPGTGDPTGVGYVPGQPIEFNGWRLTLTGTPAAGDTVGIAPTANPAVDNRNARAMVALGDRQLVDGRRFVDAFAELVADVGSRTAHSQTSAETSAAMLGRAQGAQAASSGVNLDEEAARLLQYQQAYQASARVIAAANSMFDTILSVVSR